MVEEDPTSFNIRSPEGEYLCPACGFQRYFDGSSYDENGPQIATGICPCCLWEPGYHDVPAASGVAEGILNSLREYRRGWSDGPTWIGKPAGIPAGWNGRIQFDRLLEIAPWVK